MILYPPARVDVRVVILWVLVILIGGGPGLAREFDSGWATGGDALRYEHARRAETAIPGWASAPKTDKRVKRFVPRATRAFGLLTGDRIDHRLLIEVEKRYQLQRSSLPPSRWVTTWLELQDVKVREIERDAVNRYRITLNYQLFATPRAVTQDYVPGFDLRFAGSDDSFTLAAPDWIFSVSPLLKPEPEAEAIADIPVRADAPPPLIDTSLPRYGLALCGTLSLALGVCCLYLRQVWPFRRGRAPFAQACRQLRAIQRQVDAEEGLREGFRVVHQAFNEVAGEVVFAERLDRFLNARPAFAARRADIEEFYGRSRQLFFGRNEQAVVDDINVGWLRARCREFRAAEREAR